MSAQHYLDHAATTAVRPEAAAAYAEELSRIGNPSSLHAAGRAVRRRLEEAREAIAAAVGADPAEIIFTSGGTEADNLVVKGAAWAMRDRLSPSPAGAAPSGTPSQPGAAPSGTPSPARAGEPTPGQGLPRLLVSAIEHHAVLDAAGYLSGRGEAEVAALPVHTDGVLDLDALRAELAVAPERTALVSVMWANNETGVIQPIPEIVTMAHDAGVPVHSDAVQTVGRVPVDFRATGLDAMTITGHKIGAPVGTGALVVRRDLALTPLTHGGGQGRGIRSGTLDVAGARAFAVAITAAVAEMEREAARLAALRDDLAATVVRIDGVRVTGPTEPGARLPGLLHITVEGADADALLLGLDMAGICASSGSACQAGVQESSHVLMAMGHTAEQARSALRFSLGRTSTAADVAAVAAVLPGVVANARRAHAAGRTRAHATGKTRAHTPGRGNDPADAVGVRAAASPTGEGH